MSFLKPSVFIKTFLIFCAIFAATLLNSCKQLASFDPGVDGARVVVNKTFSAPTGLTVTQGRKQKISLEWIPVSGARYYDIYCAKSATSEFEKIYETDKNSFDDKVNAGSTVYYKVCAVKSNGTQSAFSQIVKGTSLAQPVISGGNITDSSATISWFMENSRSMNGEDNYEDQLSFEVFCERSGEIKKSKTLYASDLNYDYKYTFDGLAGATDYQFYIKAYNYVFDQQNYEESAKVNNATLTSYMPLAPKFNASVGTSAKGIHLYITLPEKVMVNTVTKNSPNEKVDELYPLYFKIYRKIAESNGNYSEDDKVRDLYYNGSTEPPNSADYDDLNKGYKVGDTIEWFDDDEKLQGGVKYEYMIRSYPDKNYDTVVCPENTGGTGTVGASENGTTLEKAAKAIGWKSAHPSFKVKSGEDVVKKFRKDEAGNNVEVLSYKFGFSAEWNDLGKAGDYRFAIKQNRKPLDANDSDGGTDTWLGNDGSVFFDTLDEINSRQVKFGSESDGLRDDEKGVYSYTLYIVPKDETQIDESKVLDSVAALDTIQVTEDVNLPKASLDVEDGYRNKVVLKISSFDENDADVTYKITRTILKDGQPVESPPFDLDKSKLYKNKDLNETCYDDEGLQDNCSYSYILTATNPSGAWAKSQSKEAETLGTPDVSFKKDKLNYDSVTISFDGVLAAKKYIVKLGDGGGFGGGKIFQFDSGFAGATENAEVSLEGKTYSVTIKGPEGYDDASLAGKKANVTVTAHSGNDNAKSEAEKVNVLGPALLEAKVDSTKATDESISLTWKEVKDAKGYLIRRVMYSDAAMKEIADDSDVTYYCDASGKVELANDERSLSGRIDLSIEDGKFTLKDIYNATDSETDAYEKAQAKIAWGLPFRYVVLPVLGKDDFSFEDSSLELDKCEVAYANLAPTAATATWGYGLNLVAEKAMSGMTQNIKWEKPNVDNTVTRPIVYRRVAGETGEFERFRDGSDEVFDENAVMNIKSTDEDSLYGAFEYLVKYYPKGASTDEKISPPDSLLDSIAKQTVKYDTPDVNNKIISEQNNKGYLLAIKGFSAEIDSKNYYERISWSPWNYKTRAVGPDNMIILIQNNNISAEAKEAVEIVEANSSKTIKYVGSDLDGESLGDSSIRIKPKNITSNGTGAATTDGLLKVLRDYKHNYSYRLQRAGGEEPITASFENNIVKTAYRQITDEELIKATMLILADVINDSGIERDGDGTGILGAGAWERAIDGATGYVDWWQNSLSKFRWRIKNYQHKWVEMPSNNLTNAFITLADDYNNYSKGEKKGGSLNYLYNSNNDKTTGGNSFDSSRLIPIYITGNEGLPASYSGTLEFAAKKQYIKVKLSRNGVETYSTTEFSGNEANKWCPINLDGNGYLGQNSDYGWWPSSN